RSPTAPAGTPQWNRAPLADPVQPGEPFGEQPDEQRGRESDDVQVVAVDPFDQTGAETLDRVGTRASLPLAGGDVRSDVAGGQRPEGDTGRLGVQFLPGGGEQAEAGNDLVD